MTARRQRTVCQVRQEPATRNKRSTPTLDRHRSSHTTASFGCFPSSLTKNQLNLFHAFSRGDSGGHRTSWLGVWDKARRRCGCQQGRVWGARVGDLYARPWSCHMADRGDPAWSVNMAGGLFLRWANIPTKEGPGFKCSHKGGGNYGRGEERGKGDLLFT